MEKIVKNFLVISNYNDPLDWVSEYSNNYLIYDKSDSVTVSEKIDKSKVMRAPNIGYNLYDYFTYIIDHYEDLPDTVVFTKGNIVPRHVSREYFDRVVNNSAFTPMLDRAMHGGSSWPVSFFGRDGLLHEINNSWYLKNFSTKYFHSYNDFLRFFYKNPKIPLYVTFAPGASYVVPKETILKLPKIVYENLRLFVSHATLAGETHILERALYTLWTSNQELNPKILKPLQEFSAKRGSASLEKFLTKIKTKLLVLKNKILSKNAKILSEKETLEIKEYRKNIKVYDVFTYNGEADILEIRLNVLKDFVDTFVIVEAPTTFSGIKKPLYFEEHKERFADFSEKIKYFVIEDYPKDPEILQLANKDGNVPKYGPEHWRREFYQKESIKKALVGLNDNDVCFVSDVDEIWNPETVFDYRKNDIFKLRQVVSTYYLNNISNEPWTGTLATKYKNIKNNSLNALRSKHKTIYTYVANGGWHFTNMGGIDEIRRKLQDSYTEESYNTKTVQQSLETRFGNTDYMGRNYTYKLDETKLPDYVLKNKEKYIQLFK